jgi:hypothetical protein
MKIVAFAARFLATMLLVLTLAHVARAFILMGPTASTPITSNVCVFPHYVPLGTSAFCGS